MVNLFLNYPEEVSCCMYSYSKNTRKNPQNKTMETTTDIFPTHIFLVVAGYLKSVVFS